MHRTLWVLVVLGGCKDPSAAAQDPPRAAPAPALVGIYPDRWRCDLVAPPDELRALLGGSAKPIDSPMDVPAGVPHPCSYEVASPDLQYWTFDVDCRPGMKQRADALFTQYRASSSDAVARAPRDGGGKPGDLGSAARPEPAIDVEVGARALDHHGQGLLFIDDDAPCYVRVTGKDAARRLAIARMIAKNLTLANAPMPPRARR